MTCKREDCRESQSRCSTKGNVLIEGTFNELEKSDDEFVAEFLERDSLEHLCLERRAGSFVSVSLVILAAGIFIIGSKQYLFTSTYSAEDAVRDRGWPRSRRGCARRWRASGTVRGIELPTKPTDKITF